MFKKLLVHRKHKCFQGEKGQDLAEYAILLGLIALLVVVSLTIIGTSISEIFSELAVAITAWI